MKKVILLFAILMMGINVNAQLVKIYKNSVLTDSYINTSTEKFKVLVENSEVYPTSAYGQLIKIYKNGVLEETYTNSEDTQYKVTFIPEPADTCKYVDLGLPSGTLWATHNVGANNPEDTGTYFSWGETGPQREECASYRWFTYDNGGYLFYVSSIKKYNSDSRYGTVDNKTELEPSDDAATVNWGTNWQLPDGEQFNELLAKCTGEKTSLNGVAGSLFTGINGNFIFMPAAAETYNGIYFNKEWGYYLLRTISSDNPCYALCGELTSGGSSDRVTDNDRDYGCQARPVRIQKATRISSITLDDNYSLVMGETKTITPTFIPENAYTKTCKWTSSDEAIVAVDASTGVVTAKSGGTATITCAALDGSSATTSCTVTVSTTQGIAKATLTAGSAEETDVRWVQLWDNGPRWAVFNVGATKVSEYGGYYCWGSTIDMDSSHAYSKSTDDIQLTDEDTAYKLWGSNWQMPTKEDYENLIKNCNVEWTADYQGTGVAGEIFTGKNDYQDNSVFFPASGGCIVGTEVISSGTSGLYWSSSSEDADDGISLEFNSNNKSVDLYYSAASASVRAIVNESGSGSWVLAESINVSGADVIPVGASTTLSASFTPANTSDKTIYWSSDNTPVATVDANTGYVTGVAPGTATISATVMDGSGVTFTHAVQIVNASGTEKANLRDNAADSNNEKDVQWVQLWANGPKWAVFNIGATKETEYGNYYPWGGDSKYYRYSNFECSYVGDLQGTVFDTAKEIWGNNWMMPTSKDYENLLNTDYTDGGVWMDDYNGIPGLLVTGKDAYANYSVFFPAAGGSATNSAEGKKGDYWASNTDEDSEDYFFSFTAGDKGLYSCRGFGSSVRPILDETCAAPIVKVKEVTVSESEVEIIVGHTAHLYATATPDDAPDLSITWSSSNTDVAVVDADGVVTGVGDGTATITATSADGSNKSASCVFTVKAIYGTAKATLTEGSDTQTDVAWVRLWHDGPKWAVMNVGATSVSEYGGYYSWGGTVNKDHTGIYSPAAGDIQGSTEDTAKKLWGNNWQMPRKSDFEDLIANCSVKWVTDYQGTGIKGHLVTGQGDYKNNSVFFPAAGTYFPDDNEVEATNQLGYYCSSAYESETDTYFMLLTAESTKPQVNNIEKQNGYSVRAILDEDADSPTILATGVTISSTTAEITPGQTITLTASVIPSNATNTTITLSPLTDADAEIIEVNNSTGVVTGKLPGTATVVAKTSDGTVVNATCKVTVKSMPEPDYVDLGLPSGTLWATSNLGTTNPEEEGAYFVWGTTEAYSKNADDGHYFGKESYKFYDASNKTFTKYTNESGVTTLEASDDPATVHLGSDWCTPTEEQVEELISNTTIEVSELNGTSCLLLKSKINGNSIYLSLNGARYGTEYRNQERATFLWVSSLYSDASDEYADYFAQLLYVSAYDTEAVCGVRSERYVGYPIRPVRAKK